VLLVGTAGNRHPEWAEGRVDGWWAGAEAPPPEVIRRTWAEGVLRSSRRPPVDTWVSAGRALAGADACAILLQNGDDTWTSGADDIEAAFALGSPHRATLLGALKRGTVALPTRHDVHRLFGMELPFDGLVALSVGRRTADGVLLLVARARGEDWLPEALPAAHRLADAWGRRAAEDRIDDAEARLAMLDRLLRRVLSIISHDLRNPLFAIQLGVKVLERQHGVSEAITSLQRSVSIATSTLRRVVDAARAVVEDPGITTPSGDEAAVAEICRRVVERLAPDEGRVAVEIEEALRVRLDQATLERLVHPLLENALQHGTPDEPVRMAASRAGRMVVLEIANAGSLPFSTLDGLEPFEHRSGDGLGVGLVLTRRLARMSGTDFELQQDGPTIRARLGMRLARAVAET
jgi:sigma-B regulation protein RsbU (phosphoserine phosphatase)